MCVAHRRSRRSCVARVSKSEDKSIARFFLSSKSAHFSFSDKGCIPLFCDLKNFPLFEDLLFSKVSGVAMSSNAEAKCACVRVCVCVIN